MSKTTQLSFPAADPFILRAVDGRYYLYCTSEDGSGIPIHVSDDLVHWQRCGTAIGKDTARWGVGCFWAPECYEINGKYYLFYSADWKENPTGAASPAPCSRSDRTARQYLPWRRNTNSGAKIYCVFLPAKCAENR